jgi:hypothetical protein
VEDHKSRFHAAGSSNHGCSECGIRTAGDFLELWRKKLCTTLADVVALERAVDLISEGFFDGHNPVAFVHVANYCWRTWRFVSNSRY